jgi:hypothetical protein
MVPKGTSRTPRQNRYQTLYQRIPFPCAYHFGTAQTGECPSCQSELSGYNSVRRSGNNPANNGQGGRSRSSGNVGVRGRPVQEALAAPGSTWVLHINGVLPRWSWAFGSAPSSRRYSTKSRVGHVARQACLCRAFRLCRSIQR